MRRRFRNRRREDRPGRKGGPKVAGPGGYCYCPNCEHKIEHKVSQPCGHIKCPKCGFFMIRE